MKHAAEYIYIEACYTKYSLPACSDCQRIQRHRPQWSQPTHEACICTLRPPGPVVQAEGGGAIGYRPVAYTTIAMHVCPARRTRWPRSFRDFFTLFVSRSHVFQRCVHRI